MGSVRVRAGVCKDFIDMIINLGYRKTTELSSGKAVYFSSKAKRDLQYIVEDIDSHNGGIWKGADSIRNLGSRTTRSGTYDQFLNRIGD
jgi:hypothetical protein